MFVSETPLDTPASVAANRFDVTRVTCTGDKE
jgi:hypothetical protein